MIFYIIGILIILYSFSNFKRAFMLFLIFKMVLVQNITLVSIPGVPLLTLEVFLTLYFIFAFLIKRKHFTVDPTPFPFKTPFILLACSWTLSTIFAYIGFGQAFSQYLRDICQDLLLVVMMWFLLRTEKDFLFVFKGLIIVFFISCIYGLYENFIQANPLADYELTLNADPSRQIDFDYSNDVLRGYRIKSIFEHPIGAGIMWAMCFFMVIYIWMKSKIKLPYKYFSLITAGLSIVCILYSRSRGPILFFLISCLGLIDFKKKKFYLGLTVAVVLLLIFGSEFSQFSDNITSIFSSKVQSRVGGSNADMRLDQLGAAFLLMKESPIVGLGYKYLDSVNNILTMRLLGGESMWFTILPQFGIVGIVANFVMAYYSMIKIPSLYKTTGILFFSLAYWITASLTSVPGLKMYLYYFIYFFLIKQSRIYQSNLKMIKG